jgi:phage regulator Rha-like protein
MEISKIDGLIHVIRGQRVMLDSDLAGLYGVLTKRLNQAVRRNKQRFPEDFMFQLTREEALRLRSQSESLEKPEWGRYSKYWPMAFTEHGVAMLSSVLNSERAVQVNVAIIRAFIRLRSEVRSRTEFIDRVRKVERTQESHELELGEHAVQIHEVFAAIRSLRGPRRKRKEGGYPRG